MERAVGKRPVSILDLVHSISSPSSNLLLAQRSIIVVMSASAGRVSADFCSRTTNALGLEPSYRVGFHTGIATDRSHRVN